MATQRPSEIPIRRLFPNEAKEALRRGEAIAVDVRSPELYAAGHIPGALSIPLDHTRAEINRLPKDRALIFYCT